MGQVVGDATHGELAALDQDEAGAGLLILEGGLFEAAVLGIVVVPAGGSAFLELAAREERPLLRRGYLCSLQGSWSCAGSLDEMVP